MEKEQATKKSPLKDRPLRYPGQSLDEAIQHQFDDEWMPYFLTSLVTAGLAGLEWWRYAHPSPPRPWAYTILAAIVVGYTIFRSMKIIRKVRALKLGRDGEKVVGQFLEELRAKGAMVFHDIPANGFNVDHVVISPKGIYVIETKTYSKPNGREATVRYDGVKLTVDGKAPSRDPVKQIQAIAAWMREFLAESTGKAFSVKPVVVFPGWYVETVHAGAHDKVWVLNPKGLPSFIQNDRGDLPPEDLKLVIYHLSRYIRTQK